jgi:allophanate hydrolase subunit 1
MLVVKRRKGGETVEDWKEDLLMSLLECGYRDLERLNEVLAVAGKFNISIDDILDYAEEITEKTVKFNDIMYSAMRLTLDKIADLIEHQEPEIAEKLRDWEILVNYMDSWFNIETLDNRDVEEIEKLTSRQIIENVKKEIQT